jgi:hypothetical protein
LIALVLALLATIVVETLVVSLILRRFVWLPALAIQLLTWPVAQALASRGGALWAIELGVFLAEIALWRLFLRGTWRQAALLSLAANGVTAAIAFGLAALR